MADTEKNEDQKISRCLQEAFGYTDEQLLKQLDQANETLKDVTFDGAEDRIMKKIMARKAELEKETSAPEPETERNITLVKAEPEERKDKKIVRFGKKKVLATVALVAVIAGMLGGTAVGKKNYFFRKSEYNSEILLDNDKNNLNDSQWEEIYDSIKDQQDMPLLRLGYWPENMNFAGYDIYKDGIEIRFSYKNKIIYFIQRKKEINSSTGTKSDREIKKSVVNKWLNKNIEYYVNDLENGLQECGSIIIINNYYYYMQGCMPEDQFKEILEYLYIS